MAHECPECGILCHCGGDIDDLLLNRDVDVNRCTHCPPDGAWDGEPFCDDDEDRVRGCCFPGECLMPGEHTRDECHTVEMVEAWEQEQKRA